MSIAIRLENLCKTFHLREIHPGFKGIFNSLFHPNLRELQAINKLSFEVKRGEKIAFIGPNGAGKSTTIKMLTGILYPTAGHIEVLDCIPWQKRHHLSYHIGTVFGQRSQLWQNLPALDTFALLATIYELEQPFFQQRLKELTEAFGLQTLLYKPVRQLSLGERMRCEIVASLLHRPQILFLDEPTIGLDINAKLMIRNLLNTLSQDHGTTLFLTSHDTADLEQVCDRVIILDKGTKILDSPIRELKRNIKKKILSLVIDEAYITLNMPGIRILQSAPHCLICEVDLTQIPLEQVIQEVLKMTALKDVTIEDPSMEDIIRGIYAKQNSQ